MPRIDYRSELRRPVSLALLGLAVLGWIVAARLAWVHSESGHDHRRQVSLLTAAETSARTEVEQLRQASGTLAEAQGKIAAAQSNVTQFEQSRAEARARLAEVEQNLEARRRSVAEAATKPRGSV
jgi:chromosome segregation ATPase